MAEQILPGSSEKEEIRLTPEVLEKLHRRLHPYGERPLPELEDPHLGRAMDKAFNLRWHRYLIPLCGYMEPIEELWQKGEVDERLAKIFVRGAIEYVFNERDIPVDWKNSDKMVLFWWWLKGISQLPHCPFFLKNQLEKFREQYEGRWERPEETRMIFSAILACHSPSDYSRLYRQDFSSRPDLRNLVLNWAGYSSPGEKEKDRSKTLRCGNLYRWLLPSTEDPEFFKNLNRLVLIDDYRKAKKEAIHQELELRKSKGQTPYSRQWQWDELLEMRRFIRRFR